MDIVSCHVFHLPNKLVFKVTNRNARKGCEMCIFQVYSKNTRTTSMTSLWCLYCNFEHISHLFLLFLLMALSMCFFFKTSKGNSYIDFKLGNE